MPRGKTASIPSTLCRSDAHAQRTWKKAHDSAVKTYGEGRRAHRVAYSALKHEYKKEGDRWVRKGWRGPSDPQAAQSYRDKPKPTAGGKIAKTVSEARRKAKEARRKARMTTKRKTKRKKSTQRAKAAKR